jgi:hypothetical protein
MILNNRKEKKDVGQQERINNPTIWHLEASMEQTRRDL